MDLTDIWGTTNGVLTAFATVLSLYNSYTLWRRSRPIVRAEERRISFNHDRKDQLLIRIEITPGANPGNYKSLRVDGCSVAPTHGSDLRYREHETDTENSGVTGEFSESLELDWHIPGYARAEGKMVAYVCAKSTSDWPKAPNRKMADVKVSWNLFGHLVLTVSPATSSK